MKKFVISVLIAAFVIAVLPLNALAGDSYFEEATVTGDNASMRLRPTEDSPVVTVLDSGTRIGVYSEEQPGWYRVVYGNYRGYVTTDSVFLGSSNLMVGHVLKDCSIMQFANEYSSTMDIIEAGSSVTITNIVGDWYYVESETAEGFVPEQSVEISKSGSTATLLKPGMEGSSIKDMQRELRRRGFFSASITGYYGTVTEEAVKAFQKEARLSQDGIAGERTLELLYGENDIKTTAAKMAGIEGAVQLSNWDAINARWKRGTTALVTDVRTGIQFKVYRFGGWWHADCEPLTAADTAKMKKACGGKWTWDRRPIWVTINGVTYAASQHDMPHMVDVVAGNDFPGHFCIHFLHSKVHETGKECPRHQACVMEAYRKAK